MERQDHSIHIIGAGVSGLVAARVLEDHGFRPVIIEATDRPGGRVKTDVVDGYQLDHGFQVLLTAYPAAQKYLDFDALDLQKFVPGAAIFKNGKQIVLGDPLRDFSLLLPTLFSGIGSFGDKLKILKLNTMLKNKSISEIFSEEEKTTLQYLKDTGFSTEMIEQFFQPFFSGIFLEQHLSTSSRMFEFVYKMFGEGYAALPKSGIEAIPKQLAQKLQTSTFHYNTKVAAVQDAQIQLSDNKIIESDFTIIATDASKLVPNLKNQAISWKSCDTLYFETKDQIISKALIGLLPKGDLLINNIFYHTSLKTQSKSPQQLLSVTVVKEHNLSEKELIEQVVKELKLHCSIETLQFIKRYQIPLALPQLEDLQYEMLPSETRLTSTLFMAGDTQLNGSLNAAMIAGERAAMGVIETIGGTFSSTIGI